MIVKIYSINADLLYGTDKILMCLNKLNVPT